VIARHAHAFSPRWRNRAALALGSIAIAASLPRTFAAASTSANPPTRHDVVVVRAGTIYTVEGDQVIEGGGAIVVEDGRITAVGKDIAVPPAARTIDYGPDAVIAPGLVSADSNYGAPRPSERTADPMVMAVDSFDEYGSYVMALQEGVTCAYIPPAHGRLIAGQGAVVKLAGAENRRILSDSAALQGAISNEARNTPGYWKPPIPATIDVGMGVEQPQLPRSLMGAIVALNELVALARGGTDNGEYGPGVGAKLRELIDAKKPWRIVAQNEAEVRALLGFAKDTGLPIVIDGAQGAGETANDIAKAGLSVIVEPPIRPNSPGRDFGKARDSEWPRYDVAAHLARAGVKFAIAPPANVAAAELRFAAGVASRGGLDKKLALRAITLTPAEILGVADRVGSLRAGKDADFVVFNGHPLDMLSNVIAAYVDGEIAFKAYEASTTAVVVSVEQLHLGDGEILEPGEVLVQGGKILEVGRRVGRPGGASVVHGKAAMPGMIDALGHLGLEGSTKVPATRFELRRLVEPGDATDKRVAESGVTTVVLSPRGSSRSGAPMMAYKPADNDVEGMVVADPVALRFQWTERNRLESGKSVRDVLVKAAEYHKKWAEYEKKLAAWTPPKESDAAKADEKKDEAGKKESDAKSDGEKKESDGEKKKDESDSKKKPKKKGEEEPAKPLTGAWETHITFPPFDAARMRLYVLDEDGKITGSLRCDVLSDDLIAISGKREQRKVTLSGDGSKGTVSITAEENDGKLKGKLSMAGTSVDFEAKQTSSVYEIAARPELRKKEEAKKKEIKGEPKAPSIDPDLEPLRRAIDGHGAVVIGVDRDDEILECVAACERAGIKPVLLGANDAYKVVDKIRGRVAGVLLTQRVVATEPKTGAKKRNRYEELASAGIPVAFHSDAEEGAADLPFMAAYAVSEGMSPESALRALTLDAARMYAIDSRVGAIAPGLDADILLLDGSPLDVASSVTRVWVNGREVH
jgi:imidazolonepropionase-like amidohydrolase